MSVSKVYRADEVKNALQENKRDALNSAGITVSGAAKALSPVQFGVLRSSITWAFDGQPPVFDNTKEVSPDVTPSARAPKDTVLIGTNVVYARYQHEGIVGRGPNPETPLEYRMPTAESKFLEKAIRRNQDKIKRDIRRALEGKLEKQ